jgi:chromosome transmission fidelity protein 4
LLVLILTFTGEQGVVFAAASEDESPSTVYYRPYDSWASQSDWTVSLLPGEDAVVVAAGGSAGDGMGSIVVATSKGFLRFFTSSGIQRYVWSLGEEVVTMAAGKEAVIIVHREGGTSLDGESSGRSSSRTVLTGLGCQNLRYSIMDFDTFEIVQEGRIPLPRKVTLTWLGFTAEGAPAMYDSSGLLSILDRYRRFGQARWVPLLDSRTLQKEGRQENYWPVGVTDSHFTCVILKVRASS